MFIAFLTAEGAVNDNYFLVNTKAGKQGAYTITANSNNYVLRITDDGHLVVTNASEPSKVGIECSS